MEAKLQVKLAELPYLKARLLGDLEVENELKHSGKRKGQQWFDKQRLVLHRREKLIKNQIEKVKKQRAMLRSNRAKTKNPSVAVIGYTNAGKTALIKAVTGRYTMFLYCTVCRYKRKRRNFNFYLMTYSQNC